MTSTWLDQSRRQTRYCNKAKELKVIPEISRWLNSAWHVLPIARDVPQKSSRVIHALFIHPTLRAGAVFVSMYNNQNVRKYYQN
jgi:hypothetical protein